MRFMWYIDCQFGLNTLFRSITYDMKCKDVFGSCIDLASGIAHFFLWNQLFPIPEQMVVMVSP